MPRCVTAVDDTATSPLMPAARSEERTPRFPHRHGHIALVWAPGRHTAKHFAKARIPAPRGLMTRKMAFTRTAARPEIRRGSALGLEIALASPMTL